MGFGTAVDENLSLLVKLRTKEEKTDMAQETLKIYSIEKHRGSNSTPFKEVLTGSGEIATEPKMT